MQCQVVTSPRDLHRLVSSQGRSPLIGRSDSSESSYCCYGPIPETG